VRTLSGETRPSAATPTPARHSDTRHSNIQMSSGAVVSLYGPSPMAGMLTGRQRDVNGGQSGGTRRRRVRRGKVG